MILVSAIQAWRSARLPARDFVQAHPEVLSSIRLAANFSAHRVWEMQAGANLYPYVEIIGKQWGLSDVRIPLRWSEVESSPGVVDIGVYDKMLRLWSECEARVCLNIGPVKTFGWPEHHVPSWAGDYTGRQRQRFARLDLRHPLSDPALSYLDRLLPVLQAHPIWTKVYAIMLENEPLHRFGDGGLVLTDEYLLALEKVLRQYTSDLIWLINSGNFWQVRKITALAKRAVGSVRIGVDYYYTEDHFANYQGLTRYLYPLVMNRPWDLGARGLTDLVVANKPRLSMEITEAQMEPWGRAVSPGNSLADLQFMLLRLYQEFRPTPQNPLLVRLWGVERLAWLFLTKAADTEHQEMAWLIQTINQQASNQ